MHFVETLHALAGRVAGTEVPEEEEAALHSKLQSRLPSCADLAAAETAAPAGSWGADGGGGRRRSGSGSGRGLASAAGARQRYTVAHLFAALWVQAAIKGFLQRRRIEQGCVAGGGDGGDGGAQEQQRCGQRQQIEQQQEARPP